MSDLLTRFGPHAQFSVLVYAPEGDAVCLLGVLGGALHFLWSLPWIEFRMRATATASGPAARRGGKGLMQLEQVERSRRSLPAGTPPLTVGFVQSLGRQRQRHERRRHLVLPLLPPPSQVPFASPLHTSIVSIRAMCSQLEASLDAVLDSFMMNMHPNAYGTVSRVMQRADRLVSNVRGLELAHRPPPLHQAQPVRKVVGPRRPGLQGRHLYPLAAAEGFKSKGTGLVTVPKLKTNLKVSRSVPLFPLGPERG